MTDRDRFVKLDQAVRLIREVEFSYDAGSLQRSTLYAFVAQHCSRLGVVGQMISSLKRVVHGF